MIKDSVLTMEEMNQDYSNCSGAGLAEKKELAAKYGVDSKKAADIQHGILLAMREDRKHRTEFTRDDVRAYLRLVDYADQYKKVASYLAEESKPFVEYLAATFRQEADKFAKKGIDVETPMTRAGYGISYADMSTINRCANVAKFLRETSSDVVAEKERFANAVAAIRAKLDEQLQYFKSLYIEKAVNWASGVYSRAEKNKDAFYNKYQECSAKKKSLWSSLSAQGMTHWDITRNSEYIRNEHAMDEAWKNYSKCRSITSYTREEYLAMAKEDAEKTYENNISVLAEKIDKFGVNPDAMKVSQVEDDPKFFEIKVSDGIHSLYARSIWAAEYSDKVTPHFRFIITEHK